MFNNIILSLLFQLSLVLASPISTQSHGIEPWHYGVSGGIVGFIVLVLDIIVWIEVLGSNRTVPDKLIWSLLVFIFPVVGMIIYYLFSNRAQHNRGGYEVIP